MIELSPRQKHILLAIVMDYISTAEPVGSRTISRKYDLSLSPATIRNEMSELEELGLLTQLHSSSGRIPSELGYRTFVDYLMEKHSLSEIEKDTIERIKYANSLNLESILEQSAKVLSVLSNSVAIVQFPEANKDTVRHFQLLPINDFSFLILIVSSSGKVHDFRLQLDHVIDSNFLNILTNYFNEHLINTPMNNLQRNLQDLITGNMEFDTVLNNIYSTVKENLGSQKNKIHVTGTARLLKEPEFNETEKVHDLIDYFEKDEKELSQILANTASSLGNNNKPVILIGKEINISQLQDCSLIVGTYQLDDFTSGTIGLLGPTRMQYGKSVAALEEMVKSLSDILAKLYKI